MMDDFFSAILSGNNNPPNGVALFDSSDHVRYYKNEPVSGHNYNSHRRIVIQKNIQGREGYTITMYNLDGIHPIWHDNVQMAPKRMRIIDVHDDIIDFRGYGVDNFGASFADYGMTFKIANNKIVVAQLNMYDRNTSIVYLK